MKAQFNAMQKHIFTSSIGETAISQPNNLRLSVIGCITEKTTLYIDELYTTVDGSKKKEIEKIVWQIHREGLVHFDGNQIKYLKSNNSSSITGEGSKPNA